MQLVNVRVSHSGLKIEERFRFGADAEAWRAMMPALLGKPHAKLDRAVPCYRPCLGNVLYGRLPICASEKLAEWGDADTLRRYVRRGLRVKGYTKGT
jgi:hypothetical protein